LVREYVHDYGLCCLGISGLEATLRHHVELRAKLAAKWVPAGDSMMVPPKKLSAIKRKYAEQTLGTLVKAFAKAGADPALVAEIEEVRQARNLLLHNHIQLTDMTTRTIPTAGIQQLRTALRELAEAARRTAHAVQQADVALYEALNKRMRLEGVPRQTGVAPFEHMIADFQRTLRNSA